MSKHRQSHLHAYVQRYGSAELHGSEALAELQRIEMTQVDSDGFEVDLIMCDAQHSDCVCLHERLAWLDARKCHTVDDAVRELGRMSAACGLDDAEL